jgi:hypothetical protein
LELTKSIIEDIAVRSNAQIAGKGWIKGKKNKNKCLNENDWSNSDDKLSEDSKSQFWLLFRRKDIFRKENYETDIVSLIVNYKV